MYICFVNLSQCIANVIQSPILIEGVVQQDRKQSVCIWKKNERDIKNVNDSLSDLCFLMTLLSKLNDVKYHYTFKSDNMWPGVK